MLLKSKFVDREAEMAFLEKKYASEKAELAIIYGRRRIGKTYLLRHFIERHGGLYLLAEESKTVLEDFSYRVSAYFGDRYIRESPFSNWKAFFLYLSEKAGKERTVVIIDEVQYIAKNHREFLSVLQKNWDMYLKDSGIMLILCGSLVSFMDGLLSYSSPIYGRRTGAWEMGPIPFRHLCSFHDMDAETCVMVYSVFGGIPQYWADYEPDKDLWENLRYLILSKGAKYYDEPKYLLKQELREVSRYFSILRAIAQGYRTFGRIADRARVDRNSLGKYLDVLENMGYIVMETPATGGRRGGYRIRDNMFNFWFGYVFSRREELEMGIDITGEIKRDFNAYVGRTFEEIAAEFLRNQNARGTLPARYDRIGRWWNKGEEIDIIGTGKNLLLCEVKWKNLNRSEAERVLEELIEKKERSGLSGKTVTYCIIAKRMDGKEKLGKKGVLLYELEDLVRLQNSTSNP